VYTQYNEILELVHIHEADEIFNEQINIVRAGRMKFEKKFRRYLSIKKYKR